MKIKQLFCKHNFIDCCSVSDSVGKAHFNYQDFCSSRKRLEHCKKHDSNYKVIDGLGMCDYYYQKCSKCGKIKRGER